MTFKIKTLMFKKNKTVHRIITNHQADFDNNLWFGLGSADREKYMYVK